MFKKTPYHLLPPELLENVSKVLGFGARKHAVRSWELGVPWSGEFGALMRHLWKWWGGEDLDPESGLSHLAHAGSRLAILIASEQRGIGVDDRPTQEILQRTIEGEYNDKDKEVPTQLAFDFDSDQFTGRASESHSIR